MIPLRDTVRSRRFPVVTMALLALNLVVFVAQLRAGPRVDALVRAYGLVPLRLTAWTELGGAPLDPARMLPLLTSQFFHGGPLHLLGNLLYLWIFGDNVEDRLGRGRFLAFYLLCGIGAGLSQVALDPRSTVPMIGASGAIAGVLGAYLWMHPRARVLTLIPIVFLPWLVEIPAWVWLLVWFGTQLFAGLASASQEITGGVAFWAHVGGFVSGMLLGLVMAPSRKAAR